MRFADSAGLASALLVMHALVSPAWATNFAVSTTADSGSGSLRAAVTSANGAAGADSISFSLGGCPCVISLVTPLSITGELSIVGPGAGILALDGGTTVQVIQSGSSVPVAISDLTIRNARSATTGGGISAGGPLTLTRVTLQGNTAHQGGGVYASQAATVVDSVFDTNTATGAMDDDGGGLYAAGPLTITGSGFVNNSTTMMKGYGGGGGLVAFGATTISTTAFIGNTSSDWGGGAYIADFASARPTPTVLTDVQFTHNTAQSGGGGLFMWFEGVLHSVDLTDNYAGYRGGGVYGGYSGNYRLTMDGGQLLRNSATGGGGLYSDADIAIDGTEIVANTSRNGNGGGAWTPLNATVSNASVTFNVVVAGGNGGGLDTGGSLTLANSTLSDNETLTGSGGGSGAGTDATVTGSRYLRNSAHTDGGGLLAVGTAYVSGSTFDSNTAGDLGGGNGGGLIANATAISRTTFIGNQAGTGGAVLQLGGGTIVNSLFARNHAVTTQGEALALQGSGISIRYATIAASPAQVGSAIYANGGTVELLSNIITSHGYGILRNAGSVTADYNLFHSNLIDTQGASVTNGHPVAGDPRFVDPAHDDYHLQAGSAAIDAGPAIGVATDIDGDPRPQGGGYDLGCYEFILAPTTTTTVPQKAEICGNCLDDDANGLTDFEDPACCAMSNTAGMTVKRVSMAKGKKGMTFALSATLARSGVASGNASTQDVFVQILQSGHDVLCARVPAANLTRKKATERFRDRSHAVASASGLDRLLLKTKKDGSGVLKVGGRGMPLAVPSAGSVRITLGLRDPATAEAGNRCAAAQAELKADRNGAVRAP